MRNVDFLNMLLFAYASNLRAYSTDVIHRVQ